MKVRIEIPALLYQRDNHTYAVLTKRGNPIIARGRLQREFDAGFKHGLIVALGGQISRNMSGQMPDDIDEWLIETCKTLKSYELCKPSNG